MVRSLDPVRRCLCPIWLMDMLRLQVKILPWPWMRTALFWVITQRVVVISFRRFWQPIGPILMGQGFLEISVRSYCCLLRINREEHSSYLLHSGSLK
jgi:hypothetical protein